MVSIRQVLIGIVCEAQAVDSDRKTNRLQKMESGFEARRIVLRQAFKLQRSKRGHIPREHGDSRSPTDLSVEVTHREYDPSWSQEDRKRYLEMQSSSIRPEEYHTPLALRPWSCADVSLAGTGGVLPLVLSTGSQTPRPHVRFEVLVISSEPLESFSTTFSASSDGRRPRQTPDSLQAAGFAVHSDLCLPKSAEGIHLKPNPMTKEQIYDHLDTREQWECFNGQSTDTSDRASGHRTSSRRV